ncbi:MAG: YbaN family protein [Gemmataceae bacterium]
MVRLLFVGLGLIFVSLGFLGAILPGLPATPFFLLAAFFFARSSDRLHRWLLKSPVAGPLIRDWQRPGGGVRWQVKAVTLVMLPCVIASSIYLAGLSGWRMFGLIGLGLIGATVVILLPLAKPVVGVTPTQHDRNQPQTPS